MVTRLVIPSHHQQALVGLAEASAADIEALSTALADDDKPRYVPREALIARVADALPESVLDPSLVVDVLLTMSSARTAVHPQTAEAFASGVAAASNLDLPIEARAILSERLVQLLSLDVLVRSAKVVDLADEHERIYHSGRVLTDIRPVFADDPANPPEGALTFHTLKLEYFAAGRVEEITLALDDGDMKELKHAVDRALDKAATLSGYLESIGLEKFDTNEGRD